MWTQQLQRLAKVTGRIPPGRAHQLCNTVAVPAFTYTSDIWYVPPFKLTHKINLLGSVTVMKLLCSIQGKATHFITGALNDTTFNILEVHAHILPIDLLFRKTQMNAVTCICALPTSHPLAPLAHRAASQFVNRHRSPLHYLFHQTQCNPLTTKHISTFYRHPFHKTTFTSKINPSKDLALELAQKTHCTMKYKIYCDGSSFEGGIGTAAVLYKNERALKVRRAHLGTAKEHTIHEAESTGVLLALSLLNNLSYQLTTTVHIGLNSQAIIHALNNQSAKPSYYLLDHIHTAVEKLQQKQDKLQNLANVCNARSAGNQLAART